MLEKYKDRRSVIDFCLELEMLKASLLINIKVLMTPKRTLSIPIVNVNYILTTFQNEHSRVG